MARHTDQNEWAAHPSREQLRHVRRSTLRLRVEDRIAAARVGEHVVAALLLVDQMERVAGARVAAILVRVAVGEAAREDAMLRVEDRHLRIQYCRIQNRSVAQYTVV